MYREDVDYYWQVDDHIEMRSIDEMKHDCFKAVSMSYYSMEAPTGP